MKLIPLNVIRKSIFPNAPTHAMVDDEDYDHLMQWNWSAKKDKKTFYAARTTRIGEFPKTKHMSMQRQIMDVSDPKIFIDHADRNTVNNQRYNLRIATESQNNANRKSVGKSPYLGVYLHKGKYPTAKIRTKKGRVTIGSFKTEEEAAMAYDAAAKIHHGKFANLNFKD